VVIDHRVMVRTLPAAGLADAFRLRVRAQVHVGEIHPDEEWLVRILLSLDEISGSIRSVVVDGLHPLLGQRTGVFTLLLADLAEARINRRIVLVGSFTVQNASWPIL